MGSQTAKSFVYSERTDKQVSRQGAKYAKVAKKSNDFHFAFLYALVRQPTDSSAVLLKFERHYDVSYLKRDMKNRTGIRRLTDTCVLLAHVT